MYRPMTSLAVLALWTLNYTALAADGPVIHYRFDQVAADGIVPNLAGPDYTGQIRGAAKAVPLPGEGAASVLELDGASGCVEVPGAEGLYIGPEGLTLLATVRFADAGTVDAQPDAHDMILFKDKEFLLGRTSGGNRLYVNLHDGKGWAGSVIGGECRPGVWTHVAAVIERIDEPPQGRVGYYVRLLLNGELVAGREILNCTVPQGEGAVNVGKGWGGPWYFHGDMAQVSVYPRALGDAELNELLKQEKLAKVKYAHIADADPRYPPALAQAQAAIVPVAPPAQTALNRLLSATTQATHLMDTQAQALPYLQTIARLAQEKANAPADAFSQAHPEFQLLDNGRIGIAFYSPRPGATALCSLYDLEAGHEVLGEQRALWRLKVQAPGSRDFMTLDSADASLLAKASVDPATHSATLQWTHVVDDDHPLDFVVRSEMRLEGPRLTMGFGLRNGSPRVAVREVQFPMLRLAPLHDGVDQLLVPRMSGVLTPNPVKTHFRYEGDYPSGAAHMQFFAYYDDSHGVYVACEDPKAWSKALLAGGAGDDCEVSSRWFVGCPGDGANDFSISGKAAVELFSGDWFDAAQIYKRFAQTAAWWPASRSREDTPSWYRDLTVWFIGNANTPAAEEALIGQRRALGLPIGLHWYGWNNEPFDDDYPHFSPREGFQDTVARLRAEGIYAKPYINARLWETKDRGDEDFQYTSVALPATTKDIDGKPHIEGYNKRSFSPMCPTTPLWQRTVADLCARIADYGVGAIYLDQISAARPRACFDKTHPHVPGAGEAWLEQGYWPMLTTIRRELSASHPDVALNAEDAAEPYIAFLDGCLPWRFVDIGHVPAYQAIYAGRIQLTSRHYDDTSYEALFPKAAEQMLYGEQIGWFSVGKLQENPAFAAFVKKLAYTRKAFLPFFNEGDMQKPGSFSEPPPTVTADWGFYGPRIITTPAVLHSAWRVGDSVAVLFANTTCDPVTVQFTPRLEAWGLPGQTIEALELQEGAASSAVQLPREASRGVTVPPYGLTAWLLTDGDPLAEGHAAKVAAAAALFGVLKGIDDEAGMTPESKRAELDKRNPWTVPGTPVRSAAEWIEASQAPKLVRAKVSPDGTFVGWIADGGSLCFGPVDLGAGGEPVLECEVAVPPTTTNGRLRLMESVDGKGVTLGEAKLESTGGYQTYAVMRLPLPEDVSGVRNVVLQIAGSGGGICNIRRWRVVRER